jgi:hypothetical protein
MKWHVTGAGLKLAGRVEGWHTLDDTRQTQWYRSTLAGEWLRTADRMANEVGPERAVQWEMARVLRLAANSLQNNGANSGDLAGVSWGLELDEPADESEAA